MMKLLLIDDSRDIGQALSRALAGSYHVDVAGTAADGIDQALLGSYDCIILDLSLPDAHGLSVCQSLRDNSVHTPILVLTGDGAVLSKISLMDAGADDYMTKPFSLGELKVRLRVLTRRANHPDNPSLPQFITVGDLTLDCRRHRVERAGRVIPLRRKEFALLECLMRHAGTVVSRDMLCSYGWHDSEDPWNNTVDVHIKYLRDRLDRPFDRPLIKTVHGFGYTLVAESGQPIGKRA